MRFLSRVVSQEDIDQQPNVTRLNSKAVLVDGVLFSRYWQSKLGGKYAFHPFHWGRYLFDRSSPTEPTLEELTRRSAISLPDKSLAFYYPNNYSLNRMRGPDLVYSAISQSEILASYMQQLSQHPRNALIKNLTQRVLGALLFKFESGGVNLNNVALLELPLYRANPEIILNGWLHALLHLNDYAVLTHDKAVEQLIERNLQFFVEHHHAWYDQDRNLSKYSDTSPITLNLRLSAPGQKLRVYFDAKSKQLPDYSFKPVDDPNGVYSAYDTRIKVRKPNSAQLATTCSTLFDTIIASDARFTATYKEGRYDPMRATPGVGTKVLKATSTQSAYGFHFIRLSDRSQGLICGYPTNFAKANRKNFYHMQHIVALSYLARAAVFDNKALKQNLSDISLEWLSRTQDFQPKTIEDFYSLASVLKAVNGGKFYTQISNVSELGLHELEEVR